MFRFAEAKAGVRWRAVVHVYCVLHMWFSVAVGVRMSPCGSAGYQDVVENTTITFTCDQYTGSVTWNYNAVTIGTCPAPPPGSATTCSEELPSIFTLTYINVGSSSMSTSRTAREPVQSGAVFKCSSARCGLHVIVAAVVSQPTTDIIRHDSGYTVSLSADITKVYSSRGLYSCVGQLGSVSRTTTPDLHPPASNTSNTADRSGSCDVTIPLPSNTGDHSCSVTVNPGNTQRSCGTIVITRPSPPTITCPSDVIPENTSLTCTCHVTNIGQPGGRLRWFTGTGSDVTTEVISGVYDVSSVPMTWNVSRGDHNVRKFRCVNNWTVNITADNDYTAQVAWGPDAVSIQGDTTFYTDINGTQNMTLTCQASDVNPSSALTYQWNVPCDVTQQSTCTFRPRPPDDDNRVITCTVTNVNNNNRRRSSSVTLDLKYPPLSAPSITSSANTHGLLLNTSLSLTCHVTGGDPAVTSVTLTCPGGRQNSTSGQSSSVVISPVTAADNNVTCACRGHWVRESYYPLTSSVTFLVYYPTTDTTLLVNNDVIMTVNESEAVTLVCRSRGRPSPDLKLLQRGALLARQDGGSVTEERSQLSHTDRARCNNTGTVTCRAENEVGDGQTSSVTLHVNCKPRSTEAESDPPKVNFITTPVTVTFLLEAFPLPHTFTFHYLGTRHDSINLLPPPDGVELSVTCINTFADYAVRCDVTVSRARDSSSEGFYSFTAANAFGEDRMVFLLKVNESNSGSSSSTGCTCDDKEQYMKGVAVGAGVGVSVMVVVVVVVVVAGLCLLRRRHWTLPCGDTTSPGQLTTRTAHGQGKQADNRSGHDESRQHRENPGTERPMTDVYELTAHAPSPDTAEGQAPSVYSCLQTSDVGVASVYSQLSPYTEIGAAGTVYENSGSVTTTPEYITLCEEP